MPSTVGGLFAAANVARTGVVSWSKRIPPPKAIGNGTGVYAVALTDDRDSIEPAASPCPLSKAALQALLDVRPELTLDGVRPDAETLGERLASFWCPDEVVVYIGSAGPRRRLVVSELSDRVAEYYSTRLGARSPHAGGWPLKTLANLSDLYVHYAYCDDVLTRERLILEAFATSLSDETRDALHDATNVMPFANLEDGQGRRKAHGIKGARAPRVRGVRQHRPASVRAPTAEPIKASRAGLPTAGPSTPSPFYTQRVSAGDIRRGIIRIPGPAKVLFPPTRTQVQIELHGERTSCRWDPRYGPDQERSGVLGVGTALTRRLITEGERLSILVENGVFFLG